MDDRGVSIDFLRTFLTTLLQNNPDAGSLTSGDVRRMIMERTENSRTSLVVSDGDHRPANAYVIHCHQSNFKDFADAVINHFDGTDTVVWIDIFCYNQHLPPARASEHWRNEVKNIMETVGHPVLILSPPWDNPLPLTRAWCLWEIFCAITLGFDIDIAMSLAVQESLFNSVEKEGSKAINRMIAQIDIEKSECYLESDKNFIYDAVRNGVGFVELNSKIFEAMRKFMVKMVENFQNSRPFSLKLVLASLHENQGAYERAKTLLKETLEEINQAYGESSAESLAVIHKLANLCYNLGKYELAKSFYFKILAVRKRQLGNSAPDTLIAMSDLGRILAYLGDYEMAEFFCQFAFDNLKKVLGAFDKITLSCMNDLARAYDKHGKYDLAEPLYREALHLYWSYYGENDLDGIKVMSNLSNCYANEGKLQLAIPLCVQALEARRTKLGPLHPSTLTSEHNHAYLLECQGLYQEAELVYSKVLKNRVDILGYSHPYTLITMHARAGLYEKVGKYLLALESYKDLCNKRASILGKTHPDTLDSLSRYISLNDGRYGFANDPRLEVLRTHNKTAETLRNALLDDYFVM